MIMGTVSISERLRSVGMEEVIAKEVETIVTHDSERVATKEDIGRLEQDIGRLGQDISRLEQTQKVDVSRLEASIDALRREMSVMRWMIGLIGGMSLTLITICIAGIIGILLKLS